MYYNIIVIGAFDNALQAKHEDLVSLYNFFETGKCIITCYDVLYDTSREKDNITYKNDFFDLGETCCLQKDANNIIIEFCNLLDENAIHHNLNQHVCLVKYEDYKMTFLACGCGWNKGFPIECIMHIIQSYNIYTPTDALSVDSFLYVISSIEYIYQNKLEHVMEPYIQGIYQVLGTCKWRANESENIMKELFCILGTDIPGLSDMHKDCLQDFLENKKKWNQLPWHFRESISNFIYHKFV
jgi:hypothetical protein